MEAKNFFRPSPLKVFILLEMCALLIVSYQVKVDNRLNLLEKTGLFLFSPFQLFANRTSGFFFNRVEKRKSVEELKEEIKELRLRVRYQEKLEYDYREEKRENARLRKLLELEPKPEWHSVVAEITGKSSRYGDFVFLVNKGSLDGLREDLGVICSEGVVGVLWQVTPFSSKILTLRNQAAVVACMTNESSYLDAYSVGDGEAMGRLENVPNFEAVKIGEQVLTSGMDSLFPKGIPVGTVSRCKKSSQMFQEVDLYYKVNFSNLEEVIILIPRAKEGVEP